MKRVLASILCAAIALMAFPVSSNAAAPRGASTARIVLAQPGSQNIGEVSGNATKDGKPLVDYKVRLRNTDSNSLVGEMRTGTGGAFKFTGLPVGNYVVETVDDNGNIIATSATIGLAAGAMIAGNVGVATSAAVAGGAAVGGGLAASTIIITGVAAVAGVTAAVVATTNDASASGG